TADLGPGLAPGGKRLAGGLDSLFNLGGARQGYGSLLSARERVPMLEEPVAARGQLLVADAQMRAEDFTIHLALISSRYFILTSPATAQIRRFGRYLSRAA